MVIVARMKPAPKNGRGLFHSPDLFVRQIFSFRNDALPKEI